MMQRAEIEMTFEQDADHTESRVALVLREARFTGFAELGATQPIRTYPWWAKSWRQLGRYLISVTNLSRLLLRR
jgi:hypothetical protein